MSLIEEIKSTLLNLKKDYPFGILEQQNRIAINYNKHELDSEFLDNVINKGFKLDPKKIIFNNTAEIVFNFGVNEFKGELETIFLPKLTEISKDISLKKQLWTEIQRVTKLV